MTTRAPVATPGTVMEPRGPRLRRLAAVTVALAALLAATPAAAGRSESTIAPDVALKAAFLLNFAKFVTWPAQAANGPISICVVGDDRVTVALLDTVRDQVVADHRIEVRRSPERGAWSECQVLFAADAEGRRAVDVAAAVKAAPVLTVSDVGGFARTGIIELSVEGGRMRFAINVDAAGRSGLRVSSRLLALARIVRDDRTP